MKLVPITHFYQRREKVQLAPVCRTGRIKVYIDLTGPTLKLQKEEKTEKFVNRPEPLETLDTTEGDTLYDNVINFFTQEKINSFDYLIYFL